MKRKVRYAVSPKQVHECLLGLLEYENLIVRISNKSRGYIKRSTLNFTCPICIKVNHDCYKCAASKSYFNSCNTAGGFKRQFISKEISANELLMKLWEQVVLTREWIWDNWK